jgi:hypothetical protein
VACSLLLVLAIIIVYNSYEPLWQDKLNDDYTWKITMRFWMMLYCTIRWSPLRFGTGRDSSFTKVIGGDPYAARFGVWFKPVNHAPDRKLFEKNYKIEGWQR